MKLNFIAKLAVATMALLPATQALAETRITYKSAKSTSSYYQMAVQIAEGMKAGSNGDITVTVEESQGSVQNLWRLWVARVIMCSPRRLFWSSLRAVGRLCLRTKKIHALVTFGRYSPFRL